MAPVITMPVVATKQLEFSGYSPEHIAEMLSKRFGMYDYLTNNGNTRTYVTSGKKPNLPGWLLYLFEHEGRDTTIPVLCANGDLSERSAASGLTKLNEILYPVFHLKIERIKDSERIRLSTLDDAKAATDEFLDKFRKVQREYARTCEAFSQVDPERARLLMDQAIEQRLAAGAWSDKDAGEMHSFRRALAPTDN